jgi:uncharacterized membrane protein required for colicin V production
VSSLGADLQTWFGENLNGFDAVYAAIGVAYALRGLWRGLSAELAGAIGFVLILVGGWRLYRPLADWLLTHTRLSSLESANLLALLFSLVVLALLLGLVRLALRNVFARAFEGTAERAGGLLAGGLKGVTLCAALVFAVGLSGHAYLRQHLVEESAFGRLVDQRLPAWYALARERLGWPAAEAEGEEVCEPASEPLPAR